VVTQQLELPDQPLTPVTVDAFAFDWSTLNVKPAMAPLPVANSV
jgi:hypothetical protein